MFDPQGGDVLICDNDNVGVNRQSKSQVWGTMEFMAPELIQGEADPSTETDLHSLAVLLFSLWIWHHPFHGKKEFELRVWDIPAKKKVYGTPVFIFDPSDRSNALPLDPDYETPRFRWGYLPPSLQELFTRAFTTGVSDPKRRVTEGEWQRLFQQLEDGITACPKCHAENIWEPGQDTLACWHCRSAVTLPPKLVIHLPSGHHHVLLTGNRSLRRRHLNPSGKEENDTDEVARVVPHPQNPSIWGIRNLTETPWKVTFPDGKTLEVGKDRSVPLNPGTTLTLGSVTAEIRK